MEGRIVKPAKSTKRTVLLKGASGTGKTHQYRTLVEGGLKGLYVDVEDKLTTIRDLDPDVWLIRKLDVPLTRVDAAGMESDFIDMCRYIRAGEHPYDFVYFDSLMRYSDELLFHLMYRVGIEGHALWRAYGDKLKRVLTNLVALAGAGLPKAVHVIGTWGVEIGTDPLTSKKQIQPVVDGKMVGPRIDYFFDDVLYLTKVEDAESKRIKFVAYLGGTDTFTAKVSTACKMEQRVEDPNLFKILEVLHGSNPDKVQTTS